MKKFRLLHIFVIIYLVAAFSWWAILLYSKNYENYHLVKVMAQTDASIDMDSVSQAYDKQKKMIIGEGTVFGLSILFGLLLIYRAYNSEIQTNNKLNSFLLSVTHELKTPIASLKLANETLQRKGLTEQQRSQLMATTAEECQRLETQVDNILAAAQLEQVYTYNYEDTNLEALLTRRVSRYRNLYPRRSIILNAEPCSSKIDVEAMSKVIDNLLHNAIKYSNQEMPVVVSLHKADKTCELTFANEGVGISDKEKSRVWEKFYRIGNEETRESQGTGLGLWIVKSIITAHKGSITILDNKPTGSIFKINLQS